MTILTNSLSVFWKKTIYSIIDFPSQYTLPYKRIWWSLNVHILPQNEKKHLFVLSALSVSVAGSSLWLWKGGNYFSISFNISARALFLPPFTFWSQEELQLFCPHLLLYRLLRILMLISLLTSIKVVVKTEDGDCGEKEDSEFNNDWSSARPPASWWRSTWY